MKSKYLAIFVAICVVVTLGGAQESNSTSALTKANLRADFREFLRLLPHARIGYIAAKYFILDAQFRQAFAYLRSQEFTIQWQQVRKTSEYRKIVRYLRRYEQGKAASDVDEYEDDNAVSAALAALPSKLKNFEIPAKVPVAIMLEAERNLSTFVQEIVASLERDVIVNWMERKLEERSAFGQLYRAMRDEKFKKMITEARNAASLSAPIADFSQHHIDVDELIRAAFEVLEWGRRV